MEWYEVSWFEFPALIETSAGVWEWVLMGVDDYGHAYVVGTWEGAPVPPGVAKISEALLKLTQG